MSVVTAVEAGDALLTVATKLLENDIVTSKGFAVLQRVALELKAKKKSPAWRVEVDRFEKVEFVDALDSNRRPIFPAIAAEGVEVDQRQDVDHPFSALDIAIEITDGEGTPMARWHVDLANADERSGSVQSGPLYHLQYGGHNHDRRDLDEPIKEPRWCHPPMELALLCEVVAANFFPDKWRDLREDAAWCRSIRVFEQLCYTAYLKKLTDSLAKTGTTALGSMWAEVWR